MTRTDQTIPAINRTMNSQEWGFLLALSVLWGGSFFFAGVAVKELPPFTIVSLRVAIAAIVLNIILRIQNLHLPRSKTAWRAFFGMGILNNVIPFSLIVWGQSHLASGLAAILNATTPLFTVAVAHFLTQDEKMTGSRLIGVIIGFIGVAVMIGGKSSFMLGNEIVAQLACLAGALSYAFAGIYGRRFKKMGIPPMVTATGQVTASSVILLPIMLIIDQPWTLVLPSTGAIAALFGLALLSTALAYIIYFRILSTAGATNLLLVTFLIPVTAIFLGISILGERLELRHLVGTILIGAGLAAIDGRLWKRRK